MKKLKLILLSVFMVGFVGAFNSLNADCNTGGPGSSSCTDSGSVTVLGIFTFSYENSISCDDGYYACCNGDGASCIEE